MNASHSRAIHHIAPQTGRARSRLPFYKHSTPDGVVAASALNGIVWITCIIITVSAAIAPDISAGRVLAANRYQSEHTPPVGAEFQSEVSQLASAGLHLKEAVEASLDGSAHHMAAIFQRDKPKAPNEAFEFRIIESDGHASKTIFKRADFFFSFDIAGVSNKINATDINGDGLKEIIVQSSSGGNCWSCNPTEIYQIRDHKVQLIAAGPVQKIVDLNGDGISELLVTDTRWESYDDLSHAASPGAVMIYAWRNGKYVYAARDFASFYKGEIDRQRSLIEDAKLQITAEEYSDESYVGLAIGLAITYAHMGQLEAGLKEMEALMGSNVRSPVQTKHRAPIIEDFRTGDSSKRLREVKYGDPMM